jgi:outer membrane protein OmpA-like peptidoglycan-associated protein
MQKQLLIKSLVVSIIVSCLSACAHEQHDRFTRAENQFCKTNNNRIKQKANHSRTILANNYGIHFSKMSHIPKTDKQYITQMLYRYNIQFIQYRDTVTLIVPIDQYFLFNSERLNDLCLDGLNYIVDLIELYPCTTVYVAAFSDDVGPRQIRNDLSQARAEAMLTFLWANGIPSRKLRANGFGGRYPIADHQTVRGAALNRRLEIQWTVNPDETLDNAVMAMK